MKKGIHPKYMTTAVHCGCGNNFTTRSTVPEMKVDICSVCHPFYTGKLKFVDTAGRIEKFKTKFAGSGYSSLQKKKKKKPPSRFRPPNLSDRLYRSLAVQPGQPVFCCRASVSSW